MLKFYRIRKDDIVKIITGKDKGKEGKVLKILRKKDRVLVENANKVKRHMRPNPYAQQPGGIVDKEMPIHISNVMLVCPLCHKPTRVAYAYIEEQGKKKKVRRCKECNEIMDR